MLTRLAVLSRGGPKNATQHRSSHKRPSQYRRQAVRLFRTVPPFAIHLAFASFALVMMASTALASEADLAIPDLSLGNFTIAGQTIDAWHLLFYGSFVIVGTLGISLFLRSQIKNLPAHESMLDISEIIFQTCKTYLIQQGKFLMMLFAIISVAMMYYFVGLQHKSVQTALTVLAFAMVGIVGSYWVAWYGIRVNTYANSPHRLCLATRRTLGRGQYSAPGGHVDRPVLDFARTGHDGDHPVVRRS